MSDLLKGIDISNDLPKGYINDDFIEIVNANDKENRRARKILAGDTLKVLVPISEILTDEEIELVTAHPSAMKQLPNKEFPLLRLGASAKSTKSHPDFSRIAIEIPASYDDLVNERSDFAKEFADNHPFWRDDLASTHPRAFPYFKEERLVKASVHSLYYANEKRELKNPLSLRSYQEINLNDLERRKEL